jgi:geranylgeranyl reductase family protein
MVTIIGAGPTGCYAAYLLAKQGKRVKVYEEHSKIGEPVQCTGITTSSLNDIIKLPDDVVVNEVDTARIYAPNNEFVEVKLRNKNIIIDRARFDQHLAEMAKKEGAKFHLKKRIGNPKHLKSDYLIGADGPNSAVAKSFGMFGKRRFWIGIQVRVKLDNDNAVEFYPYVGVFAWVVPENKEVVRLGMLVERSSSFMFNRFLENRTQGKGLVLEKQGGIVPVYNPSVRTQYKNIYLVGDAACQVKATTGGGIIQGLMAAEALADSIKKKMSYEREWRKRIGRELWLHLKMREIMSRFRYDDYNKLVGLCNQDKVRRVLEKHDRDYPSKLLFHMLLREPRFLWFAKFLLR